MDMKHTTKAAQPRTKAAQKKVIEFWEEKVQMKDEKNVARIDGQHYILHLEPIEKDHPFVMRQEGYVQFNDGRVVKYYGVSHQGKIPDACFFTLPNNGKFITADEAEQEKIHNNIKYIVSIASFPFCLFAIAMFWSVSFLSATSYKEHKKSFSEFAPFEILFWKRTWKLKI